MFKAFEWMLALRYLRARRREGFISVIAWFSLSGIALGVATLIIVMSVMNGFREDLLGRILGLNGHLSIYGGTDGLAGYEEILNDVRPLAGIVDAAPLIEGQVLASKDNNAVGAIVRGFNADDLRRRTMVADNITSGNLDDLNGGDAVVIGSRLAANLGLGVGDRLTLVSPKGRVTVFGTVPRLRAYRVVGTFQIGMHDYDSSYIFMPLEAARIYFGLEKGRVSAIEIFVENPEEIAEPTRRLDQQLPPGARAVNWQQINSSFFNALQVERNVMFLILTLIILVAVFNIISSMIMLVKDKAADIAILRTMGATRASILRVFIIAGASVGIIGTFSGFWLGMAFCWNIEEIRQAIQALTGTELFSAEIYFLSKLPAKVDPSEVSLVVLMGLGLSFLATLYPSWRAARLDPVEALRYE